MKIILFIICFICSLLVTAQTEISKKQLIEDFDYLYEVLKTTSISMDIFNSEHKLNSDSIYLKFRAELVNNTSYDFFLTQARKLFHISADKHNNFVWSKGVYNILEYLPVNERLATYARLDTSKLAEKISDKYYMIFYNKNKSLGLYKRYNFERYFDGKYIIQYNIKTDLKQKIPYGSELKKINNTEIDEIVNKNIGEYFLYKDILTKKEYTHKILNYFIYKEDTTNITFIKPNGNEEELILNSNNNINYTPNIITLKLENIVSYNKKEKTLYIAFRFTDFSDKLKFEIGKYRKKEIHKIIFDLRENGGGNDLEWIRLLSYTIDSLRIKENPELLIKNNELTKNQFKYINQTGFSKDKKYLKLENDILHYIKPDTNGLNFSGNIYCIINENTFSSAMAFASMNMYLDNFKIVGNQAPYYGGLAATPMYFQLPNTKLFFRINSSFDKKMYDDKIYRLQIDINVKPDINNELIFLNKTIKNYKSKKYLFKDNIFFNAIKESE